MRIDLNIQMQARSMSPKFLLYLVLVNMLTWHTPYLMAQDTSRPSQGRRSGKKLGVLKLINKGTALFEKKKYGEAISVFAIILRSYPSHELSLIYTARSYYRMGKFKKSYRVFSELVLENLDPDTSYEYGQVHIRRKKYSVALAAFRRVPTGHPLYDLASYYGGVCAVKIKDYQLGLDLMQQAVVLPSKLMRSRKLYQRHAEGKIIEIQKEQQLKLEQKEKAKLKEEKVPPPPIEKVPAEIAKPEPIIDNRGFLLAESQLGVNISLISQRQEFSEIKEATASHTELGLFGKFGKNIAFGENKIPHHFHIQTQLKIATLEHKNKPISFFQDSLEEFKYFVFEQDEYVSYLDAELALAPEWKMGEAMWLALGAAYYALLPDNDISVSSSRPYIFANLGQNGASYSLTLRAEYMTENVQQAKYRIRTNEYLTLRLALNDQLDFNASGEFSQFDYDGRSLDGPDWYNRFTLGVTYSFNPVFSVDFQGLFEQFVGNQIYDIDLAGNDAEFSHTNIGSMASFNLAISDWLFFTVEGSFLDRNADIESDEAVAASVRDTFPTFLTNIHGQIIAKLSF